MTQDYPASLCELTEELMIKAHQAGMAYWTRNRPDPDADVASVARATGWGGDQRLTECWLAGYNGARRRSLKGE